MMISPETYVEMNLARAGCDPFHGSGVSEGREGVFCREGVVTCLFRSFEMTLQK